MTHQPQSFPAFSLSRLLKTVFEPQPGERVAILIDLPEPKDMKDYAFLKNSALTIQRYAHDVFQQGLKKSVLAELQLTGGEMFAYAITGGSNLDLPLTAIDAEGKEVDLKTAVYEKYDIILCISTFSATAPLTAFAKQIGFRGATLHGVNQIILDSGLAVDYNEVSRQAEKLRVGMTNADSFEIDFTVFGEKKTLTIHTGKQDAQKSHGLCRGKTPDVANLPAGEIYFVPTGAEGTFPMRYEDGTLGWMDVTNGRIHHATLIRGNADVVAAHNAKLQSDPVTGALGELGFGTQVLPVSGRDIQDEKILGTMHVATGRSDHLGGNLTPDLFAKPENATHDDILFAPEKTPEITVTQVRMNRNGKQVVLLEHFQPAAYMQSLLAA